MNHPLKRLSAAFLAILLVFFAFHGLVTVSKYVGYASFAGQAGNIYELVIKHHIPVTQWVGVYGVAVRVDGYNFQQSETLTGGNVENSNLLFDCLAPDEEHEVYASVYNPTTQLSLDTVLPATTAEIDAFFGLNGSSTDTAANTFVSNVTFEFGSTTITAPGTYTYKIDESGNPATFATVALKDGSGKIFFGAIATNFTQGFNGDIINYQILMPVLQNQSSTLYYYFTDPNDQCPAGQGTEPLTGNVIGNVSSESGSRLQDVIVDVAGISGLSSSTGFYNISPPSGTYRIYAIKEGYVPYYNNITVIASTTIVHDIVMVERNNNTDNGVGPGQDNPGDSTGIGPGVDVGPDVGPGQSNGEDVGPGEAPAVPFVEEPKQIEGTDYVISLFDLKRKIRIDTFHQEIVYVYSFKKTPVTLTFSLSGDNLSRIISLDKTQMLVEPNGNSQLVITIYGRPPVGTYYGNLTVDGEINATIPVEIEILPKDRIPVEALLMNLETNQKELLPGAEFKFKTDLRNLLIDQPYPVRLLYTIQSVEGGETVWTYQTNVYLKTAFSLIRSVELPKNLEAGDYILRVNADYMGLASSTSTIFAVGIPFWSKTLWGLRYWMWMLILLGLLLIAGAGYWFWRNAQSKKKYHLKVEYAELPKPGPRNIYVGKIAETENKTYFNLENFKVHTIVAGSTGGGKSVSAQVIVEEALEHDVCVIVIDPTAQWTGMLRPCKDKVMFALYPFFGMKPTDARAFNGNIRMIADAREIIDMKKYVKPGEIQIFACHKLDPKDMDTVVANAIREIFHANFPESKPLKVLFVFDEVHRLLPKFGGSGDGFLQIERGCREFRKWGLGIVLVSQVLSDFMGTIKANINTEIQMRTRDEGDLERIRVKYGEEVLRSLVKATVGTGMVENPAYNRGKPYFIAFKPLRHSVERLPDDEIEEYNRYNDIVDDISYSLDQLEQEGIDVFDLRLELKLALDKVKQGNFNMVKIYLEGLTPRIDKQWEKIGKKPKKFEKKLVDTNALKDEMKKAQDERAKYEAEQKAKAGPEAAQEKKEWGWKDNVNPDKLLNLKNGMVVLNLASLYDEVAAMKDKDWEAEVNDKENRLADWVEKATGLSLLAANLHATKDKAEATKILEMARDGKKLPEVKVAPVAPASSAPIPAPSSVPASPAPTPINAPPANAPTTNLPPSSTEPKDVQGSASSASSTPAPAPSSPPVSPSPPAPASSPAPSPDPSSPLPAPSPVADTPKLAPAPLSPPISPPVAVPSTPPPAIQQAVARPSSGIEALTTDKPEEFFKLENGIILKSVKDLVEYLPKMDDALFKQHVGENYNHFADWVRGVFHDEALASKIAKSATKEEMRTVVMT